MTDLGALTKLAGSTVFSSTSPWRETVGYRALSAPDRREIQAVISRQAVEPDPLTGQAPSHSVTVHVAHDAEIGSDRPREGDLLDFLDQAEGEHFEWEVVEVVTGDAGRWQLGVDKRGRYVAS